MNLGYDIAQALPGLRAEAESRMTETVTVGKFELVRPPGSLDSVRTLVETYYSGIARVKYPYASSLSKAPAGQQIMESTIIVSIPYGSPGIPTGALVLIDASRSDESLVGRFLRVDGQPQAGQTTAHRYPVVEES